MPLSAPLPEVGEDDVWGEDLNSVLTEIESQLDSFDGALDTKADTSAVVALTGNQSVGGVKSFTSTPTVSGQPVVLDNDPRLGGTAFGIVQADLYAAGDGLTDDTADIQDAIDAAMDDSYTLVFSTGKTYRITAGLDMRGDGLRVSGNWCAIKQDGSNVPIIRAGGSQQSIDGFHLYYGAHADAAHTAANGLELYSVFMCKYSNLLIEATARGVYLAQATWNGATVNTCFSTHFENIRVNGYAISAIDMKTYPSGASVSTGCVWTNIYTHNNYLGSSQQSDAAPLVFRDWDESVFNQLNVEWTELPDDDCAVFLQRVRGFVFNGLHFEQVGMNGDSNLFRGFDDVEIIINGMNFIFSVLANDSGAKSVFSLGHTTALRVILNGLRTRSLTTTGVTSFALFRFDASNLSGWCEAHAVDTSSLAGNWVVNENTTTRIVRQINNQGVALSSITSW